MKINLASMTNSQDSLLVQVKEGVLRRRHWGGRGGGGLMGTLGFPSFLGKVFPSLNGVLTLPQEEWFSLERGHWGGALVQFEGAASVHSFTRNSAMTL